MYFREKIRKLLTFLQEVISSYFLQWLFSINLFKLCHFFNEKQFVKPTSIILFVQLLVENILGDPEL